MRISEITDAQGQLELLRTVIDNTWTAIAQQAEQERRAEAERKAKAKLKPRGRKAVKAPYASPPPPLKKPKPLTANTPTPNPTLANPNADNTIKPMPSLYPSYTQATPKNALNVPKDGYLDKNIDAAQNDERGDDRHSKNGIASLKKLPRNF
ncbi:hypothetical protein G6675_03520 [Polynucleobacter paneuropaeus]|nr:hypothetical protein [Polynucleobacter paneuropaeus]MBT8600016.1 hypothetical protein [Polynucleobacter paneuropaeus]